MTHCTFTTAEGEHTIFLGPTTRGDEHERLSAREAARSICDLAMEDDRRRFVEACEVLGVRLDHDFFDLREFKEALLDRLSWDDGVGVYRRRPLTATAPHPLDALDPVQLIASVPRGSLGSQRTRASRAECELFSFELECQHAGARGHRLSLPPDATGASSQVFEVVGAKPGEGDTITLKSTMARPRCSEHASRTIEVRQPNGHRQWFAEDQASFESSYGELSLGEHLWPWNLRPVDYQVRPIACNATDDHHAFVRVYPAYEVELKVSVMLDGARRSADRLAAARAAGTVERRGRPANAQFNFAIDGSIKYGADSIKLGASLEGKLASLQSVNRWVKRAIDQFAAIFREFFGVDLELELPNLALQYNGKFVELNGSPRVGPEWKLAFDANPVFGVVFKADILDLTIRALRNVPALSVVMNFLIRARQFAAETGNLLEFTMSLTGRVGFQADASKNAGERKAKVSAKGRGQILVGFGAKVEGTGNVMWVVSFKAGARIAGATGVSIDPGLLSDDIGVALTADLLLLPLKFEWGTYASGKFSWETAPATSANSDVTGAHVFWKEKKLLEGKKYVVRHDG